MQAGAHHVLPGAQELHGAFCQIANANQHFKHASGNLQRQPTPQQSGHDVSALATWPQIRMGTWWEEGGVRRTVSQFHEVMGFAGEQCGGRRFGVFVKIASQVG